MFKRGDVRLVAAAIAAISLHALLFILLPSSVEKMSLATRQGALQLELLAQDESPQKQVVQLQTPEKQQTKKQIKQIKQTELLRRIKPVHKQPASSILAITQPAKQHVSLLLEKAQIAKQVQQIQQTELHQSVEIAIAATAQEKETLMPVAQKQHDKSERNSNKQGVSIVPQQVQNRILAEVHYPRQARRHGWQGRAEFQFDVHQQSIQTVTLLASTGYPILDRAAHRGLIAASHVALSNGLYRMPVVFRLQ